MKISNSPAHSYEQLQAENRQLKSILVEGKELFKSIAPILEMLNGGDMMNLTLKLPRIIMSVKKDTKLVENATLFINKINKLEL